MNYISPTGSEKGFVTDKVLLRYFSHWVFERVGDMFMFPQQAFIEKVNTKASCTQSFLLTRVSLMSAILFLLLQQDDCCLLFAQHPIVKSLYT